MITVELDMSRRVFSQNTYVGFGLIEVLVSIMLLALIIGIAIPSYRDFINQKRLQSAVEDLYNLIRVARSESLNQQTTVFLSFTPGANWCYGLNNTAACDCTVANSCRINIIETVVRSTDYPGQATTLAVNGFSGGGAPSIIFQGNLGDIALGGTAVFSLLDFSVTITVNTKGLVTICSDNVKGYSLCTGS